MSRRWFITGGTPGGFGVAFAEAALETGDRVVLTSRRPQELATWAEQYGDAVLVVPLELTDGAQVQRAVSAAEEHFGGIDVLVNNASGYGFDDSDEGWLAGFNVDLMAAVRASRAALPHLMASAHGCILHTGSIAAFRPRASGAAYAAVKAALSQYTTSQALALAEQRIRVNAIAPGSIAFPDGLWERRRLERPELYRATLAKIPFGRFGKPEEIAHAALFLASPWAGWITGQTLVVDGGQMLNG